MIWTKIILGTGIILIIIFFWTVWSLYSKREILKFAEKYKSSDKFYPIFGNSLTLINNDCFQFANQVKKRGSPIGCWLGPNYYYMPDDSEEIRLILTHPDCLEKAELFYNLSKLIIPANILYLPVKQWKPKRKFLSKSFNQVTLNSFVPIFYKNSKTLIETLKDMENRDLFVVCVAYALSSFLETMGNKEYNFQTEQGFKLLEELDLFQEIFGHNVVKAISGYPFLLICIWKNFMKFLQGAKSAMFFTSSMHKVVSERKKQINENSPVQKSFLDSVIHADKNLYSKSDINDEFAGFAFAAADTTGNALAFLLTLLGMNLDIQDKVYEEILWEVGLDRPIEVQDLPKLKYLERVIFETLRLFPIAPAIGRYTTNDVNCGTKTFPKGINIVISIFTLHRNKRYWIDPLKFNPDRFLPEEVAKRPPNCYIPFSAGTRNCIGKTYGLMSLKVVAASVVRNFKITSKYKSVEEMDLRSFLTMRTKHNLDCQFTPR
ncbi:cytochrome P450 4C1-like [Sitophilus oryzae]|uniref:Cytochrome P450 4C1-like n=1 Tax=Sitophilus oryzae TaxID=7048 RepID=A0A6J2XX56_SITOR|nr:cytochrome P450 4C1-like [Sitophilus oryzae]